MLDFCVQSQFYQYLGSNGTPLISQVLLVSMVCKNRLPCTSIVLSPLLREYEHDFHDQKKSRMMGIAGRKKHMDRSIIFVAAALAVVVVITVLEYARREFNKKRRDHRMSQALRRGLTQTTVQRTPRVVNWQSCETTSVRCS